jgi:hypothetical protein
MYKITKSTDPFSSNKPVLYNSVIELRKYPRIKYSSFVLIRIYSMTSSLANLLIRTYYSFRSRFGLPLVKVTTFADFVVRL